MKRQGQASVEKILANQAEEQVVYLKNSCHMRADEIIRLYGGQPMGSETYQDALERIVVFNLHSAAKHGFVA